ncbi:MAG TPA: SpoIID/LytB domain-containing protein [Acidimicrobiia bacterium]|nr:SpoIID/LytB domain-containing protein [Acidimicrobiia bacterium]
MREFAVAVLTAALLVPATPAMSQEDPPSVYDSVVIVPSEGTVLQWRDGRYAGILEVRGAGDGLVLTELVEPEDYLLGIQEVPFSWHSESLKAQAVAARTYLAWTLRRGRVGAGSTYGFDICASDQCQVYGGVGQVEGPEGERWAEAVRSTEAEMLLSNGVPAQALYSSTSGGRTRSVEDVFGGDSIPYLQAVPSPDERSPFVEWEVRFDVFQLREVLKAAGLIEGSFQNIRVIRTEDGDGPWLVDVEGSSKAQLTTWEFRSAVNRWAPRLYPDRFPGPRPDGRNFPQTILSPTFAVDFEIVFPSFEPDATWLGLEWVVRGNGWGHLVGMSQYGARAMAEAGATYDEILSHYYTGLEPQVSSILPDQIVVGLAWGSADLVISADGPFTVIADGRPVAEEVLGSWLFETAGRRIAANPPEGIGLPPTLAGLEPSTAFAGRAVTFTGTLSAPAEVRVVVFRGAEVVGTTEWRVRDAGTVVSVWDGIMRNRVAPAGIYRVMMEARSAEGRDSVFSTLQMLP